MSGMHPEIEARKKIDAELARLERAHAEKLKLRKRRKKK